MLRRKGTKRGGRALSLRPYGVGNRIFGARRAGIARSGIASREFRMKLDAFERAVDQGFEFARIFYFAASGQAAFGFFRAYPRRTPIAFVGAAQLMNFHHEGLDHKFLHPAGLPEYALGMKVEMEVGRLEGADGAGFFGRFAFGGLTMRQPRIGRSLGESPLVAAVGIHQEELDRRTSPAITDRSHLKRQGLRGAG